MNGEKCANCPYGQQSPNSSGSGFVDVKIEDGQIDFSIVAPNQLTIGHAPLSELMQRRINICSGPVDIELRHQKLRRFLGRQVTKPICPALLNQDLTKLPDVELTTQFFGQLDLSNE